MPLQSQIAQITGTVLKSAPVSQKEDPGSNLELKPKLNCGPEQGVCHLNLFPR